MARHASDYCCCSLVHFLQHGFREETATHRSFHSSPSYRWAFRNCDPSLGDVTSKLSKSRLHTINNGGNWPTMGTAYMIGLLTVLSSMMGFDCSVHMCKSLSPLFFEVPFLCIIVVKVNF